MKKRIVLLGLLFSSAASLFSEEKIEIYSKKDNKKKQQHESPIPVDVGYDDNDNKLNIHITENIENVSTTIEGPEGIVYQQQITAPKGQSLSVNLQPFQEGEYTIIFQDAKGNEVEGYFTKEKEEIFN